MKWTLTPTPPQWYVLFWVAFQISAALLFYWLGPIVIARGMARWQAMGKSVRTQ